MDERKIPGNNGAATSGAFSRSHTRKPSAYFVTYPVYVIGDKNIRPKITSFIHVCCNTQLPKSINGDMESTGVETETGKVRLCFRTLDHVAETCKSVIVIIDPTTLMDVTIKHLAQIKKVSFPSKPNLYLVGLEPDPQMLRFNSDSLEQFAKDNQFRACIIINLETQPSINEMLRVIATDLVEATQVKIPEQTQSHSSASDSKEGLRKASSAASTVAQPARCRCVIL